MVGRISTAVAEAAVPASLWGARVRDSGPAAGGGVAGPRYTQKPRRSGAFVDAAEWSRTITGVSTHKALNLARLPVPPQPLGARILDGPRAKPRPACGRPRDQ